MTKYQMFVKNSSGRERVAAVVSGEAQAEYIVMEYGDDWANLGLSYRLALIKKAKC